MGKGAFYPIFTQLVSWPDHLVTTWATFWELLEQHWALLGKHLGTTRHSLELPRTTWWPLGGHGAGIICKYNFRYHPKKLRSGLHMILLLKSNSKHTSFFSSGIVEEEQDWVQPTMFVCLLFSKLFLANPRLPQRRRLLRSSADSEWTRAAVKRLCQPYDVAITSF